MFLGLMKVSPHLPHRLLCFNTWSPVGWSCFGRLWYLWNESLADGPMLLNINISCWSWSAKTWKAARVSSCLPGPIPPYLPTMAGCELLTYEPKQASHSLRWLCRAPCQSNKESNNTGPFYEWLKGRVKQLNVCCLESRQCRTFSCFKTKLAMPRKLYLVLSKIASPEHPFT